MRFSTLHASAHYTTVSGSRVGVTLKSTRLTVTMVTTVIRHSVFDTGSKTTVPMFVVKGNLKAVCIQKKRNSEEED